MVIVSAKTPRYVLKEGTFPTCAPILQTSPLANSTVIYGFSDKPRYDAFLKESTLALTPYPLIKRFLESQLAIDADSLKLIALDATSSQQKVFEAATYQAVLESLVQNGDAVPITYRLSLDSESCQYRIESTT